MLPNYVWQELDLYPNSPALICFPHCRCSLNPFLIPEEQRLLDEIPTDIQDEPIQIPETFHPPLGEGNEGEGENILDIILALAVAAFAVIAKRRKENKPPPPKPSIWEIVYDLTPQILTSEAQRPPEIKPALWEITQKIFTAEAPDWPPKDDSAILDIIKKLTPKIFSPDITPESTSLSLQGESQGEGYPCCSSSPLWGEEPGERGKRKDYTAYDISKTTSIPPHRHWHTNPLRLRSPRHHRRRRQRMAFLPRLPQTIPPPLE